LDEESERCIVNFRPEDHRENLKFVRPFRVTLAQMSSYKCITIASFKPYTVSIEETAIHYVHEKSASKNVIPLLLLRRWASTVPVSELNEVIRPLVSLANGQ
jgi:hypothetical protein